MDVDTVRQVPLGTLVRSDSGLAVGSLDSEGELFVAARGGTGGKGNGFFLSNENRAPAKMELGAVGQENRLHLELRIIADVGLVSGMMVVMLTVAVISMTDFTYLMCRMLMPNAPFTNH